MPFQQFLSIDHRIVILLIGNSGEERCRKEFVEVSIRLAALFPCLTASVHQDVGVPDIPGCWSLVLHQQLSTSLAAPLLRRLPLVFDGMDANGELRATPAPRSSPIIPTLFINTVRYETCATRWAEGTHKSATISPVCGEICLLPGNDYNWTVDGRRRAGNCLEYACGFGTSYSALAKTKLVDIVIGPAELEGESQTPSALLRQVSRRTGLQFCGLSSSFTLERLSIIQMNLTDIANYTASVNIPLKAWAHRFRDFPMGDSPRPWID